MHGVRDLSESFLEHYSIFIDDIVNYFWRGGSKSTISQVLDLGHCTTKCASAWERLWARASAACPRIQYSRVAREQSWGIILSMAVEIEFFSVSI